jgi:hypothetical protein
MSSTLTSVTTGARYILVIDSGGSSLKFLFPDVKSEGPDHEWNRRAAKNGRSLPAALPLTKKGNITQ